MAGTKFQFDESGGKVYYFLSLVLLAVLLPCTYYFLRKVKSEEKKGCACRPCKAKTGALKKKEPQQILKRVFIFLLLTVGWTMMFACAYKAYSSESDYVPWDPFEILGVDSSATEAEIRKAYRKLSLIYHPDRDTGDELKFRKIAKAYAALTDKEARKNWEEYGNPDGPGFTSFGIALPSWMVDMEHSFVFLGIYALAFMVILPVAVWIWWSRSVKYERSKVLLNTLHLYIGFLQKSGYMHLKRVIMILGASFEFESHNNPEIIQRESDNEELPSLMKKLQGSLNENNKEMYISYPYSVKARTLIHAHLQRLDLSPTLEEDKRYIVSKCPMLLQEFVKCFSEITSQYLIYQLSSSYKKDGKKLKLPSSETLENAMKLSSMIIQGLSENKSPLLQLPHVTEDMMRHFRNRKRNIHSIQELAEMNDEDRRNLFRDLDGDQYNDIVSCLQTMPHIEVHETLVVKDEENRDIITAEALVTLNVNLIRKNLGSFSTMQSIPAVTLEDETTEAAVEPKTEEDAPIDNAENSVTVRKPKPWEKPKKNKFKSKKKKKTTVRSTTVNHSKLQPEEHTENGISDKLSENTENVDEANQAVTLYDSQIANQEVSDTESMNDEDEFDLQQELQKKAIDNVFENKSKTSHSVHCPLFPDDKQEHWWIYVIDNKNNRALITAPKLLTNLVDEEVVVLNFKAPKKSGKCNYSLIVQSDSYVGLRVVKNLKFDVEPATEALQLSDDEKDELSEDSVPEDDDLITYSDDEK